MPPLVGGVVAGLLLGMFLGIGIGAAGAAGERAANTYDGAYRYQDLFAGAQSEAVAQSRGFWAADTGARDTEQAA